VAELLGVGLVTLEVVQAGLDRLARPLVRADDVDGVADRVHRLLEDEDLVLLAELADEHQNLLAGHRPASRSLVRRGCRRAAPPPQRARAASEPRNTSAPRFLRLSA
jgi:hypothetical protein